MSDDFIMDPSLLDEDERVRRIYEMEGYTLALDLTRKRIQTGMTFSAEALEDYLNAIKTFVGTRVMKYWNETGEPPVHMTTLVSVGIDHVVADPVTEDPAKVDLLDEAIGVAKTLLEIHSLVEMDTPEDKALHAKSCEKWGQIIEDIIERRNDARA